MLKNTEKELIDLDGLVSTLELKRTQLLEEIDDNLPTLMRLKKEIDRLDDISGNKRRELEGIEQDITKREHRLSIVTAVLEEKDKTLEREKDETRNLIGLLNDERHSFEAYKLNQNKILSDMNTALLDFKVKLDSREQKLNDELGKIDGLLADAETAKEKAQMHLDQAQKGREEASTIRTRASEMLSEAQLAIASARSTESIYKTKCDELATGYSELVDKEKRLKDEYASLSSERAILEEKESNLKLYELRLEKVSIKLLRDIEISKLSDEKKARLTGEAKS